MSSTHRGSPRVKDDAYYTPLPLAVKMLELFEKECGGIPNTILEPSAGEGVFVHAAAEVGWSRSKWVCVEKRDVPSPIIPPDPSDDYTFYVSWLANTDFLHPGLVFSSRPVGGLEAPGLFDLAIGNPPFSLAEQFVLKSLEHASQVMLLLRAGFLAGKKRYQLFDRHQPRNVWLLAQRPSFTGKGTDSAEYCIVHWDQRGGNLWDARLHWLEGNWR